MFGNSFAVAGFKQEIMTATVNFGFSSCYGFAATGRPLKVVFAPAFGFSVSNYTLNVVNSVHVRLTGCNGTVHSFALMLLGELSGGMFFFREITIWLTF